MVKINKKVDKRETHIKKKLTAAVIMLLVSCIMTVTSTYAWFTLSTAPEIKGVSTTVGANGSLEIALANYEVDEEGNLIVDTWQNPESITSGTNDSGKFTTWGNLIDLSDSSYGLENIVLYPAELNVNEGIVAPTAILRTPVYGVDGRVKELADNTLTGTYDGSKFVVSSDKHGVRAIGRSLSMSERQLAYRNAIDSILMNQNSASTALKTSWVVNGGHLSTLAISMVGGFDNQALSEDQYNAFKGLISALDTTVGYLDQSLISAVDGYLASEYAQNNIDQLKEDAQWLLLHNELNVENYSILEHTTCSKTDGEVYTCELSYSSNGTTTITGDLAKFIYELKDIKTRVNQADTEFPQTYSSDITINSIKTVLNYLITVREENGKSTVTINGSTPSQIMGDGTSGPNVGLILGDGKIKVELNDGSGVYHDIAEFIGNFSANVKIPEGSEIKLTENMSPMSIGGLPVTLTTNTKTSPIHLEKAKTDISALGEPSSENSEEASIISDTYGYALDFVVRTNAVDSQLLLSTTARDRVGSNDTSTNTMGAGSGMYISTDLNDIPNDILINLLECMRVVFVDGTSNVLKEARFDTSTFEDGENVSLKIWSDSALVCKNTIEEHTHDDSCYGNGFLAEEDAVITDLPTNTPYKLTAIVYLDGASIDNADVTNAARSFVGSLNLQFASSANLVPMKYSDFQPLPKKMATLPSPVATGTQGSYTGFSFSSIPNVDNGIIIYKINEGAETQYTKANETVALVDNSTLEVWVDVEESHETLLDSLHSKYTFTVAEGLKRTE